MIFTGEFVSYPTAFVGCLKSSYVQLAIILASTSMIQHFSMNKGVLKNVLFGQDDWLMVVLLLLAFGIGIGLTAIAWFLVETLVTVISTCLNMLLRSNRTAAPTAQSRDAAKSRFILYSASTLGLIRVVPVSVLFAFYFVIWFFLTCSAYSKSDLPTVQNVYRYRQSILIFLLSFLPYYIPQLIVYVKDLLIGWQYQPSFSMVTLLQDMPVVFALIYLITFGKTPDIIELK